MKDKDYINKMDKQTKVTKDAVIGVDIGKDDMHVTLVHPTQGHSYVVKVDKLDEFYKIMNADDSWRA